MNKGRKTDHPGRIFCFLMAVVLAGSMLLSPGAAAAAETAYVYEEDAAGDDGILQDAATKTPGKIAFLNVKTFKTRKWVPVGQYEKGFRPVALYWNKAKNAKTYKILYSFKKKGPYKKALKKAVAGTPSGKQLSCRLSYKNKKTVFFKVVPCNGSKTGKTSRWVSIKAGDPEKNVKSVKISGGKATLYGGDAKQYTAAVNPAKPLDKNVRWVSSDPDIAKVNSRGKVTGVRRGTVTIYALAHNGVKAGVKVTVRRIDAPKVTVSWGIRKSRISWTAVNGADGYEICSRIGKKGTDVKIASVSGSARSYTDVYYNTSSGTVSRSLARKKSYLKYTYYLDPAVNPLVYSVRAYEKNNGKIRYSYPSEEFHLEAPSVAAASKPSNGKVKLTWGKSSLADGYYIYNGRKGANGEGTKWTRIGTVKASSSVRMSKTVPYSSTKPFYTVKAYAEKNGKKCFSSYDKTFRVDTRKYAGKKVLFIGDSIAYGTPYTGVGSSKDPYYSGGKDRYLFSYPRRVYQMTHVKFTNVSVPGSSYTYFNSRSYPKDTDNYSNASTRRCLTITAKQMKNAEPGKRYSYAEYGNGYNFEAVEALKLGKKAVLNNTVDSDPVRKTTKPGKFSDYDVIILAAGTNDAKRSTALGKGMGTLSTSNLDNTNFTGAVNSILSSIGEANAVRRAAGKKPIRVVFVDLFYRGDISNGSGVVRKYQNRINDIVRLWNKKWSKSGDPKIYQYHHNYVTADNATSRTADFLHLTRFSQGRFGSRLAAYLINKGILK